MDPIEGSEKQLGYKVQSGTNMQSFQKAVAELPYSVDQSDTWHAHSWVPANQTLITLKRRPIAVNPPHKLADFHPANQSVQVLQSYISKLSFVPG